jgi:hypothetical protein
MSLPTPPIRSYALQGTVTALGTIIYSAPITRTAIISGIKFTNPTLPYDLTLSRYSSLQGTTIDLYQLTGLSAGDVLTDSFPYYLDPSDILTATSSVAGTTFIINIQEYNIL